MEFLNPCPIGKETPRESTPLRVKDEAKERERERERERGPVVLQKSTFARNKGLILNQKLVPHSLQFGEHWTGQRF